jgi:hypothetical protein
MTPIFCSMISGLISIVDAVMIFALLLPSDGGSVGSVTAVAYPNIRGLTSISADVWMDRA